MPPMTVYARPALRYTNQTNLNACYPWLTCFAGEYIIFGGSNTHNRVCSSWSDCPPGQRILFNGNTTHDRVCETCVGGYTNQTNLNACYPWLTCFAGSSLSLAVIAHTIVFVLHGLIVLPVSVFHSMVMPPMTVYAKPVLEGLPIKPISTLVIHGLIVQPASIFLSMAQP